MEPKSCSFGGCAKQHLAKGYCAGHYYHHRQGVPLRELRKRGMTVEERFDTYVDKSGDCWEWTGGRLAAGYGNFNIHTGAVRAHRLAFELANGAIPDGKEVDHACLNRGCVNPGHLRLTTRKQNMENRAGACSTSKTGIRGVHHVKRSGKWTAYVVHNGKQIHLGTFETPEAASDCATAKRLEIFTHNEMDRAANVSP